MTFDELAIHKSPQKFDHFSYNYTRQTKVHTNVHCQEVTVYSRPLPTLNLFNLASAHVDANISWHEFIYLIVTL